MRWPYNKKPPEGGYFLYGGERGIRTPGGLTLNGFQDRRFRPLSQLSKKGAKITKSLIKIHPIEGFFT